MVRVSSSKVTPRECADMEAPAKAAGAKRAEEKRAEAPKPATAEERAEMAASRRGDMRELGFGAEIVAAVVGGKMAPVEMAKAPAVGTATAVRPPAPASMATAMPAAMQAQMAAGAGNASLTPRATFNPPERDFLQNTLNLPPGAIANLKPQVSSANQAQSVGIRFANGGTATQFNTGGFPPASTATLPRLVFDPKGVLSFYRTSESLSPAQRESVQNLYATDLASRKNYAGNIANLARNLSSIETGKLDAGLRRQVDSALGDLKSAYETLSDPSKPAPDPRELYSEVADVYRSLDASRSLSPAQKSQVGTGLNILSIGASNYDTNRVPVAGTPGTPGTPAPAAPATADAAKKAGFPLPDFEAARKQPLSAAQGNPAQVFGGDVAKYLKSIGLGNVDPKSVNFQVNTADKLQAIQVPTGNGQTFTAFFNNGFPVATSANQPQTAFSGAGGARQFLDAAKGTAKNQQTLASFYDDPKNAAARTNYGTNLQNLRTAFERLGRKGDLPAGAERAVRDSLRAIDGAQKQLAGGAVPDVLGLYQRLGDDLDRLSKPGTGLNTAQRQLLTTLNTSLLPVGVSNYFLRPLALSLPAPPPAA